MGADDSESLRLFSSFDWGSSTTLLPSQNIPKGKSSKFTSVVVFQAWGGDFQIWMLSLLCIWTLVKTA